MISYRILGKSELKVTEIGLGCWAIGGPSFADDGAPNGWSGNDDIESVKGLIRAYELGINHWDSADTYGKGHSERLIGKVFREGVKREKIVLATKVGWFKGTAAHPFEPIHLRHQIEQSLWNLKTDYIDIFYFHNPYFGENNMYLRPAAELVHRLKKEGKIRVIGQSAYSLKQFKNVCPVTKPEILQLPYNAMKSPFDTIETDIFEWADKKNFGMVLFGTYAMGLLLGKYNSKNPPNFAAGDIRSGNWNFKKEKLTELEIAITHLKKRFGDDTLNLARIANQYALSKSKNAVTIPGFKNANQVELNAQTMGKSLTEEEIRFITEVMNPFKK